MIGHNDQNTRQSLEIAGGLYPVGSYGEGTEVTVETVILLDDINEMIDRKILGRLRQYG